MKIVPCTILDIEEILYLYEASRSLQRERKMVVWPAFEAAFLEREILAGRQWKLFDSGRILCNWTITLEDRDIWEERDQGDAIYIHRICAHPAFRGRRFIDRIVEWGRWFALEQGRSFVRLDTLGNNTGLIRHYTSAGFQFLGMVRLRNTAKLPLHYQEERDCCLFELVVGWGIDS